MKNEHLKEVCPRCASKKLKKLDIGTIEVNGELRTITYVVVGCEDCDLIFQIAK